MNTALESTGKSNSKPRSFNGIGLAMGIGIGAAMGAATDNMAL